MSSLPTRRLRVVFSQDIPGWQTPQRSKRRVRLKLRSTDYAELLTTDHFRCTKKAALSGGFVRTLKVFVC
jgi:hypothetical protein